MPRKRVKAHHSKLRDTKESVKEHGLDQAGRVKEVSGGSSCFVLF